MKIHNITSLPGRQGGIGAAAAAAAAVHRGAGNKFDLGARFMSSAATQLGIDLLAVPPMQAVFNTQVGWIAAAIYGSLAIGLLLWSLHDRNEFLIVSAMLVGGMCASLAEPLLDVTSGAYHPNLGQPGVFTLMGRSIPPWTVICYGIYYGGFGSLNLIAVGRGMTRRGVWLWFLAPLLGDVVLEEVMLHYGLYYYYGNQALVLSKFPLYQPAGNSTGELFCVAMLFFLRPALTRSWQVFAAAAVAMPLCAVMGFNVVAWPMDYAVHSTWPNIAVQGCAVLTWALAAVFVHGISLLIATDSPLRRSGRLVLR
jgi:hypothetical protein